MAVLVAGEAAVATAADPVSLHHDPYCVYVGPALAQKPHSSWEPWLL